MGGGGYVNMRGMDAQTDLRTADREVLIEIIIRQQAIIESLEKRIAQLEGRAKAKGSGRMPGLKPKADRKPAPPRKPRKGRSHGFARVRMAPTRRVEHAVERCPDCATRLSGGWTHRTREVIDLPPVPVEVVEHAYVVRTCPRCRRRCAPSPQLDEVVMGKQRLGINLISLMVALREEARLPFRIIQWYLEAAHGLRLSLGAIVAATQRVAQKAQGALSDIVARIRGSPVVHADETGWREDGHNGYVWTFSTPTERYFLRRGRSKAVVAEALGEEFAGALVSDFYAAYHHYDGPKQRCWAHLLRDIHDLRALYPGRCPPGPVGGRRPRCVRKSQSFHPPVGTAAPPGPTGPGTTSADLVPSLPGRPVSGAGQAVPPGGAAHQRTLRLRGRNGSPTGQQRRRAQLASSGGQPQGQRRNPLTAGELRPR